MSTINNQDFSSPESVQDTTGHSLHAEDMFISRSDLLQQKIMPNTDDAFADASDASHVILHDDNDNVVSEADTEISLPGKEVFVEKTLPNHVREDEDDEFLWTEERELEIDEALENLAFSPVPCVHAQLEKIRHALESNNLSRERAVKLLDEVDRYLEKQLALRTNQREIDNYLVTMARSLITDGLRIYQDVTVIYRQYLASGDPNELILASRLSEQASGNMAQAKDLLLQAEPVPEDEEESGEESQE